jgi:hypothetical protein
MLLTGLVIKADESMPVEAVEFERRDLSFMHGVVGGKIEAIDTVSPGLTIWSNDESKMNGSEPNVRATLLLWASNSEWRGQDIIMGDVLVTGLPDGKGDTTGIPADVRTLIMDTARYKAEVQTHADDSWSGNQVEFTDYWVATQWAVTLSQRWTLVKEIRIIAA